VPEDPAPFPPATSEPAPGTEPADEAGTEPPAEPSAPPAGPPAAPPPADDPPARSPAAMKRQALLGGLALAARTAFLQVVVFGGMIVLARRLEPKDFGAFAIVQFALTFFTFFGDAGLGGALIQKKSPPTQAELSSVFWAQIGIALTIAAIVWPLSGWIGSLWPELPESAPWILRALVVDFLATSLRVVPSILMERDLQFVRLSLLDAINSTSFYITASAAAFMGAGIWSLVLGVLVQGGVALVVGFALRPWRPSFIFDREALRPLLRFGLPFQLKFVVGMAHSSITPLYGGATLGPRPIGLINWSQTTAHFPLRVVDIVSRVSFPLYSRLQDDRAELARSLERSVRIGAFATFFVSGLLLGLGAQVTTVIYSEKWLEALPLLHIYATTITLGFLAPLVATVFDSMGMPQIMLRLSVGVAVGTWLTVPLTTHFWGPTGFVLGYVLYMIVGNLVLLGVLRKVLREARVVRQLLGPAAGLAAVWAFSSSLLAARVHGPWTLAGSAIACAFVFIAASALVDPAPLRDLLALVRKKKA
jgi:O-antigen/teichoic acid export membrane protein